MCQKLKLHGKIWFEILHAVFLRIRTTQGRGPYLIGAQVALREVKLLTNEHSPTLSIKSECAPHHSCHSFLPLSHYTSTSFATLFMHFCRQWMRARIQIHIWWKGAWKHVVAMCVSILDAVQPREVSKKTEKKCERKEKKSATSKRLGVSWNIWIHFLLVFFSTHFRACFPTSQNSERSAKNGCLQIKQEQGMTFCLHFDDGLASCVCRWSFVLLPNLSLCLTCISDS